MSSSPLETRNPAPPNMPWAPLLDSGRGYLSVFLNEPLARWPIRELTRPGDNKSDPNLETQTYGLFSTCEPQMRNRIVKDGAATVFFLTTRKGRGRLLAGYYHFGWYAPGGRSSRHNDFALAADRVRFVDPIAPDQFGPPQQDLLRAKFRTQKPLPAPDVRAILQVVDQAEDLTSRYLREIKRIETFSAARSGFAYPSWGRKDGFSWSDAELYLTPAEDPEESPNSTPSDKWLCRQCRSVIENRALLKVCPVCSAVASLAPFLEGK